MFLVLANIKKMQKFQILKTALSRIKVLFSVLNVFGAGKHQKNAGSNMHDQIKRYGLSGNFDSTIHLPNCGMCWLEVCMLDLWASMSAESVVWYSHWSQENNIISLPVTFVLFCTCNQQHGHIWITYQFISTGISTHLLLFPRKVNHHYHGTGDYSRFI